MPIFEHDTMEPVPVRLVGESQSQVDSAELSSWQAYKFVGTEQAVRLLATSKNRKRAVIMVLPGFANNNTVGNVYVGTQEQVQNRQGGILVSGVVFEIDSQRETWVAPDGTNSLTVTVLDERYDR